MCFNSSYVTTGQRCWCAPTGRDDMIRRTQIHRRDSFTLATFNSWAIKMYGKCSGLSTSDKFFNEELKSHRILQLFQEYSRVKLPNTTKSLHALTITMGLESAQPVYLYNNIIAKYVSLGDSITARKVFDNMPLRNVISYNTMISAYSKNGNVEQALKLFSDMRTTGFMPTQYTFGGLLSSTNLDLRQGFYLHGLIVKSGLLYVDAFVGTALLGLFRRYGCLDEALQAFEDTPVRNLVTWNTMIMMFGDHGFSEESIIMFRELIRTEEATSEYSFVGVLSGFSSERELASGEQIHGLVEKNGLNYVVSVANSLINMYRKCSGISMAEKMFEEVPLPDIVSWNIIMCALSKSERPFKTIEIFLKLRLNEVWPNQTTYLSIINACTCLRSSFYGEFVHAKVIKNLFHSYVSVGSSLVDFYAKCDRLEDAHLCFEEIYEKNLVSWNSLMLGYSNRGCSYTVFLFCEMIQLGYQPNEVSFSTVIKSSLTVELQQLHSLVIKMGYLDNDFVLSSLITAYAKNGLLSDALIISAAFSGPPTVVPCNVIASIYNRTGEYQKTQELFSLLEEPDIVSWNILIAACSRNGDHNEAFELFEHMQRARISPDNYTYVSLFSICTKQYNLALGSSLHGLMVKTNFNCCDTFVYNVMIDMYGKCGSLESAVKIFNEVMAKNVITWTALISTLGLHGHAYEALERFREMKMQGLSPDGVTFVAILSAFRHVGLVEEGIKLFGQMKLKFGVEPEMDHYLLVVDLLARYGRLKEAEQLIAGMPFPPNALIWRSFLQGCKKQSTVASPCLNTQP